MILSHLLRLANVAAAGHFGDAEVTGAQLDSRKCRPGTLFFCMPGTTTDSHTYLPAALANGAAAAVVYSAEGLEAARSIGMPAVHLADVRDGTWRLCRALYDNPTRNMTVVGVTGTNGKTTVAWLLRDMLRALGLNAAYLGTLGFHFMGEERELANTTPFAVELYNLLAEARDRGVEALAMEVSSHALAEKRADGVEFDAGVLTNLSQDHLDYHGSMEEYEAAKARLFTELPWQTSKRFVGAYNLDDPVGQRWHRAHRPLRPYADVDYSFREEEKANLTATVRQIGLTQITLELNTRYHFPDRTHGVAEVTFPLGGSYNAVNAVSAAAGMIALGYDLDHISDALPQVRPVPGRFEAVPNDRGIGILVDYAHTPDALEKLLDAVRPLTDGRVITVFGCGGDRDRTKRPLMAQAASSRSDITVLTSDNPRTEDPQAILDDALPGIVAGREAVAIVDRPEAIAHAVRQANPGDVVVIAGKGHENYQIIGRTKHPMDDRELAREALQ